MGFATHTGRVRHLLSLVDVMPSLVEMAGGSVPVGFVDGKSFVPVLKNHSHPEINKWVYAVYNNRGVTCQYTPYPIRSILGVSGWKYIQNFNSESPVTGHQETQMAPCNQSDQPVPVCEAKVRAGVYYSTAIEGNEPAMKWASVHRCRPADELYNLNVDASEANNLAGSPQAEAARKQLKAQLHVWMEEQGDLDPVCHDMAIEARGSDDSVRTDSCAYSAPIGGQCKGRANDAADVARVAAAQPPGDMRSAAGTLKFWNDLSKVWWPIEQRTNRSDVGGSQITTPSSGLDRCSAHTPARAKKDSERCPCPCSALGLFDEPFSATLKDSVYSNQLLLESLGRGWNIRQNKGIVIKYYRDSSTALQCTLPSSQTISTFPSHMFLLMR